MSKRRSLAARFGGIETDVERLFLNLPPAKLRIILRRYEERFGKGPCKYARQTYQKWKSGAVRMSGQTAERLLDLLPPLLSVEQRYDLIRKLRRHYLPRRRLRIFVTVDDWRKRVIAEIDKLIERERRFALPDDLKYTATWLADGSTESAQKMLQAVEEEEARQRTAYLEAEFARVDALVRSVKDAGVTVTHTISIPQGDIEVQMQSSRAPSFVSRLLAQPQEKKMTNRDNELVPVDAIKKALAIQQSRGNLLDVTFDELTDEQKNLLRAKVVEERINLDVAQAKADQRFHNSTRDMAATIQSLRQIEASSKSDYRIESKFETASGHTNITVSRDNNTLIIVVAIVIGFIAFMALN